MEKEIVSGRTPDFDKITCFTSNAGSNIKLTKPVLNSDFSALSLIVEEESDWRLSSFLISFAR